MRGLRQACGGIAPRTNTGAAHSFVPAVRLHRAARRAGGDVEPARRAARQAPVDTGRPPPGHHLADVLHAVWPNTGSSCETRPASCRRHVGCGTTATHAGGPARRWHPPLLQVPWATGERMGAAYSVPVVTSGVVDSGPRPPPGRGAFVQRVRDCPRQRVRVRKVGGGWRMVGGRSRGGSG